MDTLVLSLGGDVPANPSLKLTRPRRGCIGLAGESRRRWLEGLRQGRAAADARPSGALFRVREEDWRRR